MVHVLVAAGVWVFLTVASLAIVLKVVLALPPDYFETARPRPSWPRRLARNAAGVVLIVVGAVLSIPGVPGQGLLTMLAGAFLVDFPAASVWSAYSCAGPASCPRSTASARGSDGRRCDRRRPDLRFGSARRRNDHALRRGAAVERGALGLVEQPLARQRRAGRAAASSACAHEARLTNSMPSIASVPPRLVKPSPTVAAPV